MTEQPIAWKTAKARPRSRTKDLRHTATVLGLYVEVYQYGGGLSGAYWRVRGLLAGIDVTGAVYHTQELERAKSEAVAAAHRLHAAGVRGTAEGGEQS